MSSLQGKTVVFTGTLKMKRSEATTKATNAGATVTNAVSGKTHILVAGPGAGSKMADAQKKGVAVWTEEEFVAALSPNSKGTSAATDAVKKKKNEVTPHPTAPKQGKKKTTSETKSSAKAKKSAEDVTEEKKTESTRHVRENEDGFFWKVPDARGPKENSSLKTLLKDNEATNFTSKQELHAYQQKILIPLQEAHAARQEAALTDKKLKRRLQMYPEHQPSTLEMIPNIEFKLPCFNSELMNDRASKKKENKQEEKPSSAYSEAVTQFEVKPGSRPPKSNEEMIELLTEPVLFRVEIPGDPFASDDDEASKPSERVCIGNLICLQPTEKPGQQYEEVGVLMEVVDPASGGQPVEGSGEMQGIPCSDILGRASLRTAASRGKRGREDS